MINQRAFSTECIDSEPLPVVSKDLLPWLIKDRREAIDGVYLQDSKLGRVHDGSGLDKAKQSLRRAKSMLAEITPETDPKTRIFLESQLAAAEGKTSFYRGKVYLMDKIIAATQVGTQVG